MRPLTRTIYVRDSGSTRYHLYAGRGIRQLLKEWHVPGLWSPTYAGCQVRQSHLPNVYALADLHGVRIVDQRETT